MRRPSSRPADVRVLDSPDSVARAVAAAMQDVVADVMARRGRCAIALSGGATPRALYRELAANHRSTIRWEHVDVFWGDERFVPPLDPQSNYGMAKAALLDHVPCRSANVHAIPTDLETPEAAADAYASILRAYFGDGMPRFDLLLLGIGADGHTASLFPHSPALEINDAPVAATRAPDNGGARITLTLPVLLAAHTTFVLATGANKAPAIARALAPETPIADCPAAALRQSAGTVTWWLDTASSTH